MSRFAARARPPTIFMGCLRRDRVLSQNYDT